MTALSDEALMEFVAASAVILGLPLDDESLATVRDAMRGVLKQAALVLEDSRPPAGALVLEEPLPPVGALSLEEPQPPVGALSLEEPLPPAST